jgi:hypothetical protein
MGEKEDYDKSATPTAHASSHEDGGSDEVSVDGLAGQLVDDQPSTWTLVDGKPTTFAPSAHKTSHQDGGSDEISVAGLSGQLVDDQPSTWTLVDGKPTTFTPEAHKTSHQDGGSDEISVQGLSGTLADAQTPAAHKTSHQSGGSDEISVTGLAGLLVTAQTPAAHKTSHEDGGSDEISVTGLAGVLADPQTPAAHKTNHDVGGSDALTSYATSAGDGHITVLPLHYLSITAGTWVWFVASQYLAGVLYNSSNAQNDRINFNIYLAKGTYTFDIIAVTGASYAIITLLFDGVSAGTIDCYVAGGPNYSQKKSITDITITTAAILQLSLKVETRNASCTGWYLACHSFALYRTA